MELAGDVFSQLSGGKHRRELCNALRSVACRCRSTVLSSAMSVLSAVNRDALLKTVIGGAVLSLAINALALVPAVYLLQIYDRVLISGSSETLVAVTVAALLALALGTVFEQRRSAAFVDYGIRLYADLERAVYLASLARAAGSGGRADRSAFDDVETVRAAITGAAPGAAIDMLFAPAFLAVLFLMHPMLGLVASLTVIVLLFLALAGNWAVTGWMAEASQRQLGAQALGEQHMRDGEATIAMGATERLGDAWAERNREAVAAQLRAQTLAQGLASWTRGARSMAQICVLAVAAGLAVGGAVSAGAIIAASIILGRILQPLDQLIASWRQLASARIALRRLSRLPIPPAGSTEAPLGRARAPLVVGGLTVLTAENTPLLNAASFRAEPGEIVGIVGPVGSGKSTLLRACIGLVPLAGGDSRLGGVSLLDPMGRGPGLVGFMPQTPIQPAGTLADVISGHAGDDPALAMAAADLAGLDDILSHLPRGLATDLAQPDLRLSTGQLRRIALARAIYGLPSLVVLDEPEANLDGPGKRALHQAMLALKQSGAIVLVTAHSPAVLDDADRIIVLRQGRIAAAGAARDVLARILPRETQGEIA